MPEGAVLVAIPRATCVVAWDVYVNEGLFDSLDASIQGSLATAIEIAQVMGGRLYGVYNNGIALEWSLETGVGPLRNLN